MVKLENQELKWTDDEPERQNSSTPNKIDIRHTDRISILQLAKYAYLNPVPAINHIYDFHKGKSFLASLSASGSMQTSRVCDSYPEAIAELKSIAENFIEKIELRVSSQSGLEEDIRN